MAAIAPALDEQQTSVGAKIMVDHLAPTPVGATVEVTATVEAVDGRRVTFVVSAREAPGSGHAADVPVAAGHGGSIMTGTIVRVVVDRERFIARLGR